MLRREVPALAHQSNPVVIDGPLRVALLRWALLAADLTLIPLRPSPFDRWASAEMLKLLREARILRPQIVARFVLNRCAASHHDRPRRPPTVSPITIRRLSRPASVSVPPSRTQRAADA